MNCQFFECIQISSSVKEGKQQLNQIFHVNRNNSDLLTKLSCKMKPVLVAHVGQHKLINCETLSKEIKQKMIFHRKCVIYTTRIVFCKKVTKIIPVQWSTSYVI